MSCFTRHTPAASFAEPDPTKHVNYAFGMVLGVDDFTQEFAYLSGRDQSMARELVGYGTARGLRVTVEVDAQGPRVVVAPGVAVSPRGQLICVESAQCAYLNQWLAGRSRDLLTRLGSPPATSVKLYVVLCYRDCPTDNVPIPGEPCRSDSQLTAPSRLADDFELELSFRKPEQREEDALTDFVRWLKQVTVSGAAASVPLEQFLQAIRDAAGQWLAPDSPPSSPPSVFLLGSPPAFLNIHPADLCRYTEAAFRLWVTELRPRWIGRRHGCAPAPFGLSREHDEECVLLAELDVPLLQNLPAAEWVAGSGVALREEGRPYIVHLRMLQEWLLCAQGRGQAQAGGAPPPPPPPVNLAGDVTGPPSNNLLRRFGSVEIDQPALPGFGQVLTVVNVGGQRRWRAADAAVTAAVTMNGDVTGASNNNTVAAIRRTPVVDVAPTVNQVLTAFNDAGTIRWRPANPQAAPAAAPLGGDVTGAGGDNTVERIRRTPVDAATPTANQVLMAVQEGAAVRWRPSNLPAAAAVNLAGDATGPAGNVTVERLRRVLVDATAPTANQVLMAVQEGGSIRWRPANLPAAPAPAPVALGGDVTGAANDNTVVALRRTPVAPDVPENHQMLTAVLRGDRLFWRPTNNFVRFAATREAPTYGIVAAGVITGGVGSPEPAYANIRTTGMPGPGIMAVTFDGYQQPVPREDDAKVLTHHYIIKVTPVALAGAATNEQLMSLSVVFGVFEAANFTLRVTNAGVLVPVTTLRRLPIMIEVSRFPLAD